MTGFIGFLSLRVETSGRRVLAHGHKVMLRPPIDRSLFSRQVQPAYICLPSTNWVAEPKPVGRRLAARVGLAPTPNGLTGRRATLTLPGNELIGAAGRSCTCISSFRRRTPRLFRPRQRSEMVGAAGFPPATSGSQARRSKD